MTSDPESRLFDFAASNRVATNDEEEIVTEVHAALGITAVPLRLRRPPTPTVKRPWQSYLYVTMTFALVIAVATAGLLAVRDQASTPSPTEVPEVVLGLASEESTAVASNTCDFSRDIPLFAGVNESPIDGPAVLLTTSKELVLQCAGVVQTIAEDIDIAVSMGIPGVIFLQSGDETSFYNLPLDTRYVVSDPGFIQSRQHMVTNSLRPMSRYWVVPSSADPNNAAVLDFQTMEEIQLHVTGNTPARLEGIGLAASNYDENSMVLSYSNYNLGRQNYSLAGFIIVTADSEPRFQSQSQTSVPPNEVAVSPDGDYFSTVTFHGEEDAGTSTIRIHPISGNEAPISTQIETMDQSTLMLWLKSGEDIVYTDGTAMYKLSAVTPGAAPEILLETNGIIATALTRDEDTIVVATMDFEGVQNDATPSTFILNAASGETIELAGRDIYLPAVTNPSERNVLLLDELFTVESQGNPLQVYDAVTGDHLGEVERHTRPESGDSIFQIVNARGEIGVINFGADSIWQLLNANREPNLQRLEPPAVLEPSSPISVSMSEDGWIAVHDINNPGVGWFMNINDPDTSWQEISIDMTSIAAGISFIAGSSEQSPPSTATPVASPIIMLEPHEPIPGFGATERDMPVLVSYVDSLPDSERWHQFNPNTSQMKIRFDFDSGFAELAVRNGVEIQSTFYPNIFLAYVPNGVQIVNISSLSMITIQTEVSADELERINFPLRASQWMVIPDTSLVIDTNTMAVMAMNQYIPGPVGIYSATASDDGSTLVAAVALENETIALARIHPDGEVDIIHTDNEYERFDINVLSPNGRYLATKPTHAGSETSSQGIEIIDLESGAVIASAEIFGRRGPTEPLWVEDGTAIVFASDDLIQKLTIESNQVDTVYESQGMEFVLRQTRDSNVILVQQESSSTSATLEDTGDPLQVIVIDVRDGSVITALDGRDQTMGISTQYAITRNAAMVEVNPAISSIHELDVTVIDTATGEVVGTIERPAQDAARTGAVKSAWGTVDGDIQFVSWGSQYTYKIVNNDGSATVEKVPPPPGAASENDLAVSIRSSGDSGWLAMHVEVVGEWWIADLTGSEPTWQQLPAFDQAIFASAGEPVAYNTATPVTSPVAAVCDLTEDVPFIAGLDTSPIDRPVVLHTMNRELVIDCDGNQTMLLGDVMVASPTTTPHVLHAITEEGDYFINILSREQLFIPAKTDNSTSLVRIQPWSPWMLMRSSTNEHAASVYNLETMTETPIVTHARVPLSLEEVAESPMYSDNNRLVIAYPWVSEAGTKYLNGFFVVEADGSSNVIVVGHEAFPRELAVSPDGQLLATASFHGSRGEGTTTVTLFGPQDDMIIEQYELRTMDQPVELTWQHDGSGLLLHDIFNLYRIDAEYPGDGLEVLAEGQNLQGMVLTPDNDVVAIGSSVASQTPSASTLIVHIPSGEVTEVSGQDLWAGPYLTSTRTTLVLTEHFTAGPGGMQTLTVVNAVTGEVVGEVENETQRDGGFSSSSYGTGRGDITVVAFAPDSMWKLVDENGNATLEQIPSPPISEGNDILALTILTSEDGHISLQMHDGEMTANGWILQPGSTEWIQLDLPSMEESQGMLPMVAFIPGAD